jgi:hypothetical protein
MNVVTQISGNIRPGNKALFALKTMLAHIGINVTQPAQDESLFYKTDMNAAWQHYEKEVDFYKSIEHSAFHIVYNDGPITNEIGLQILYAMLKERPIIMTGAPNFDDNLLSFIRDTITKHFHDFHSINLPELELTELSLLLYKLKPTNYSLSKGDKILIRAGLKAFFRSILRPTQSLKTSATKI